MNQISITGRITHDLNLSTTAQNTSVLNFTLACDDYSKKENETTYFMKCTAWSTLAENLATYTKKGDQLMVFGELKYQQWENNKKEKREGFYVYVQKVSFGSRSKQTHLIEIEKGKQNE